MLETIGNYIKNFWPSIIFYFVFSLLLIGPAICFLMDWIPIDILLKSQSIGENNLPLLYDKIKILAPWVIVCLTAIIVIFFNTMIYFASFNNELLEAKPGGENKSFQAMTYLFIFFILCFIVYTIETVLVYTNLHNIFQEWAYTSVEMNAFDKESLASKLIGDITNLFGRFITGIEIFTVVTIITFIVIDSLSKKIKMIQINNTSEDDNINIDLIKLQKEFVSDQLWLIDVPVLIGVILITAYTRFLPKDTCDITEAKFIFVTGGIGMHIIMSQIIFIILNMKYKFNEFRLRSS